ncbi:hypothetical protein ECE50_029620 [Chitinophaga sp. Mgbs1]|uniref:Uncharacterized protein n=1 Tax=Chitinophaga solisilvae TaxID=1233460 RepID=A0A9Q5D7E0_9BACT|nr:hypothetical protein [Chitinophaga solisilvae]
MKLHVLSFIFVTLFISLNCFAQLGNYDPVTKAYRKKVTGGSSQTVTEKNTLSSNLIATGLSKSTEVDKFRYLDSLISLDSTSVKNLEAIYKVVVATNDITVLSAAERDMLLKKVYHLTLNAKQQPVQLNYTSLNIVNIELKRNQLLLQREVDIIETNKKYIEALDDLKDEDILNGKADSLIKIINEADQRKAAYEDRINNLQDEIKAFNRYAITLCNRNASLSNREIWNDILGKGGEFFRSIGVQGNLDRGVVYSELASGAVGDLLRLSFGTAMATANDDSTGVEKSQAKLLAGGGNAIVDAIMPLIYTKSPSVTFFSNLGLKGTGDLPVATNKTGIEAAGSGSLHLDLYADVSTSNKKIKAFLFSTTGYYAGSGGFYDNLKLEHKAFLHSQVTAGFVINQSFIISALIPTFGTYGSLLRNPIMVGIQLVNL